MAISAPALLKDKWPLFVKFGVTKSCIYQSMEESVYDGNQVSKVPHSSHNIEIVFDVIKEKQFDESTIRSIDRVAIFPSLLLPVAPKLFDLIVDESLREWEVREIVQDPADAHYEMLVRPIK